MLSREKALEWVFSHHGNDAVYITNTGYLSRAVYAMYPDHSNILYMQGSMGLSACIGLGLAICSCIYLTTDCMNLLVDINAQN